MKLFFVKLLVFLTLFAAVDWLVGKSLQWINDGTIKGDIGRNNYIMNDLNNRDVLIFGSSRAIHHYSPQIIGDSLNMSCYNCGEDGMGIILSYSRLKAILSRYKPRVIIYDVEPAYDYELNDNEKYLGKLKPFYPKYGSDRTFDEVSPVEKYKMFSSMYRYNSQPIDLIIQRISSSPQTGEDYTYAPLKKTMNYEPAISPLHLGERDALKCKYLRSFMQDCNDNNIKLYVAISPRYKNTTEFKEIDSLCLAMNVPILNHYTDSMFNSRKDYFADQAHLNEAGATAYSKIISREIKQDNPR